MKEFPHAMETEGLNCEGHIRHEIQYVLWKFVKLLFQIKERERERDASVRAVHFLKSINNALFKAATD